MKLVLWHLGIAGGDGDKVILGGADHDPGQQVHKATPPSLLLELEWLLHSILQTHAKISGILRCMYPARCSTRPARVICLLYSRFSGCKKKIQSTCHLWLQQLHPSLIIKVWASGKQIGLQVYCMVNADTLSLKGKSTFRRQKNGAQSRIHVPMK